MTEDLIDVGDFLDDLIDEIKEVENRKKVIIIAGGKIENELQDFLSKNQSTIDDFLFVGVDSGCQHLLKHKLPIFCAIGDFDSINQKDLKQIKLTATNFITLNVDKDNTDTEEAIAFITKNFTNASITMFGATAGRLDHLLANLNTPNKMNLASRISELVILDSQNKITYHKQSDVRIVNNDNAYQFIGLVFLSEAILNITKAKFLLENKKCFALDSFVSNEFIDDEFCFTLNQLDKLNDDNNEKFLAISILSKD